MSTDNRLPKTDEQGQFALFEPNTPNMPGRHAKMLEIAIAAAKDRGYLEEIDEAMISIARANATALDNAETLGAKSCYAISNLTGPYREVLEALRMTPEQRNEEANDELAAALAELSTAAQRDA